ncbi:unnamed protein product, partial [Rotaria sp. Silwood2]
NFCRFIPAPVSISIEVASIGNGFITSGIQEIVAPVSIKNGQSI